MSVFSFINATECEQAAELCDYLRGLGAELHKDLCECETDLPAALDEIISSAEKCFSKGKDEDIEAALNSIVTLVLLMPTEIAQKQVRELSAKLSGPAVRLGKLDRSAMSLRVLHNLFQGHDDKSPLRYHVYRAMLTISRDSGHISRLVQCGVPTVRGWCRDWELATSEVLDLLRLLHDAQLAAGRGDDATRTMLALLAEYTDDNAELAKDDAYKCVSTHLANPTTFLYDHLLRLKPVALLRGDPVYDLLSIFVRGSLHDYLDYYAKHKESIEGLSLDHEKNLTKMRLLTFMSLAADKSEISFAEMERQLDISRSEVESFVIEVLKTQLVKTKIDEVNSRVIISSTIHRTFEKEQWVQLREKLSTWKSNISKVQANLTRVTE